MDLGAPPVLGVAGFSSDQATSPSLRDPPRTSPEESRYHLTPRIPPYPPSPRVTRASFRSKRETEIFCWRAHNERFTGASIFLTSTIGQIPQTTDVSTRGGPWDVTRLPRSPLTCTSHNMSSIHKVARHSRRFSVFRVLNRF